MKQKLENLTVKFIWILLIALLASCTTVSMMKEEQKDAKEVKKPIQMVEDELNTAGTSDIVENREPWLLNAEGNAQAMPTLVSEESHQRFKELAEDYWLDASLIWETENYYGLKEGTILCIAIAETSWWTKGYWRNGCYNFWNVGNNDRGNRHCYPNAWAWLAAIGKTLTNDLLGNNQTIACLNWAGNCIEPNATTYRYSTGKSGNWQRNMIGCFYSIYQTKIDPSTFNLHQR